MQQQRNGRETNAGREQRLHQNRVLPIIAGAEARQ
jgi:hypothetical protein